MQGIGLGIYTNHLDEYLYDIYINIYIYIQ
jgi:hypothetical protein